MAPHVRRQGADVRRMIVELAHRRGEFAVAPLGPLTVAGEPLLEVLLGRRQPAGLAAPVDGIGASAFKPNHIVVPISTGKPTFTGSDWRLT